MEDIKKVLKTAFYRCALESELEENTIRIYHDGKVFIVRIMEDEYTTSNYTYKE